jgi:hypothetical protein
MLTILYIFAGFIAGVFGGMGMGGGTILIPVLTIFFGVNQQVAQATNLLSFLPMAALSLMVHKRQGLLQTKGVLPIIISAILTAILGGLVAVIAPAKALKKVFGLFLLALAVYKIVDFFNNKKADK